MRNWLPLLFLVAGCSAQPDVAPGKIVSNNPCVDAILAEVAEAAQVGAVSAWSHDAASASAPLAWARRYPAIGAEVEALISARPSIALIGAFGRTDVLDKAGVRHMGFGVPATVKESAGQVRSLAEAIGRRAEGETLARAIEIAATPEPIQGERQKRAIIWLSGGFVPGKGTIQDELLSRAGYRNASATYGLKQWDVLPLETLIRNPPDVIFTPLAVAGDDRRSLAMRHRVLARISRKIRVVPFPEKLLNCGGPSIISAMKVLKS